MRRKYLVLRNRCPNISAFPVNGFWSTLYSSLMSYIIHKYMCVIPKRQLFTIILNEKKIPGAPKSLSKYSASSVKRFWSTLY